MVYVSPVSSETAADPILNALRARGSAIARVRYRANRTVLLSVSRDGRTLNSHACFRRAPAGIARAIAAVLTERSDTRRRRAAMRTLKEWEGTRRGLEAARRHKPKRRRRVDGDETRPLRQLFDRLNREQFRGALPEIPLRVSHRMTRSLGTIRYREDGAGSGGNGDGPATGRWTVLEIAISADLLAPANRTLLEDTMLHEMAHAEAWLTRAHKGHGAAWKRIARRVGCRPAAVNDVRVAGRTR